jgi:hypothetical protein
MAALGDDHLLTGIHPFKQFGQAGLRVEHPNGDGHTNNLVNWCSGVDPHVAHGRLGYPRFLDATPVRTNGSRRSIRVSVACALSLGNRAAVPEALLVLTLIGLALGTLGASRICVVLGRPPWGGLVISMSPGLLFATTVSTTETVVLAAWIRYAHVRLGT